MRNSKARDLYEQRKTLKRQLYTLEQDKIQPFIESLYKTLPPEWREVLARNNILTRVLDVGNIKMVLHVGSREYFHTEEEAIQKCRELQKLLAEHMAVAIGREPCCLVELTFILDPAAV